jgi:cytochrome c
MARISGLLGLAVLVMAAGCGKEGEENERGEHKSEESREAEGLTAFELEHGIGPIKEAMTLASVDGALAERGKGVFELKCSMCHKMDTTYIGPALGEVTTQRSPAYIMNMILNPQEMVERHPIAKKLLAERMTFMANQNLTMEESRAVLGYLRTQAKGTPKS